MPTSNEQRKLNEQLKITQQLLAADAQTSGGLLISLPVDEARSFIKELNDKPTIIGQITKKKPYLIRVN